MASKRIDSETRHRGLEHYARHFVLEPYAILGGGEKQYVWFRSMATLSATRGLN